MLDYLVDYLMTISDRYSYGDIWEYVCICVYSELLCGSTPVLCLLVID